LDVACGIAITGHSRSRNSGHAVPIEGNPAMNNKAYWPKALALMAACIFIVVIDILPMWVLVAALIIVSAFALRWFLKGPVRR
jgi:hypothetical protein